MATFNLPQNQDLAQQFKSEDLSVGWPWRLFSFSGILFLASALVYIGLTFGYEPFLNSRIQSVDSDLGKLGESISQKDEEAFVRFYSQLSNLNGVLNNHIFGSKVFSWLELNTHPKVYYAGIDLKIPELQLTLSGVTDNFGILGEQLAIFDKDPLVAGYVLNQSVVTEGAVRFTVIIKLAKNFFNQ